MVFKLFTHPSRLKGEIERIPSFLRAIASRLLLGTAW